VPRSIKKKRTRRPAKPASARLPERPKRSGVDARMAWAAVSRYPLTTAVTVLVAAVTAAAVWLFLPLPRLTGSMTFQVSAAPNTLITPVGSDRADFQMYRQRQAAAVKSRMVLNKALNQPGVAALPMLRVQPDPVNWLDSQVRVDFRSGPELMRVTLEGDDEEQVKAILEAIAAAYLDDMRNRETSQKRNEKLLVEKTLKAYTDELAIQQQEIRHIEESVGAADPSVIAVKQKIADERLWMTQKQLFDVQAQIRKLDIDLKLAQGRPAAAPADVPEGLISVAVRADLEVQRLAAARKQLTDQVAQYQTRLQPGAVSPAFRKLEGELAATQKEYDQAVARVRADTLAATRQQATDTGKSRVAVLAEQMATLREYEKVLTADADAQMKRVKTLDGGQSELSERREKVAEKQRIAQQLASRVEAIRIELDTPARAELFERPDIMPGVEGFRRLRYTALAGVGVLAVGLGLNFARVLRDPRVTGVACVETQLGLPVIGSLPRIPQLAGDSGPAGEIPGWRVALSEALATTRLVLLGRTAQDQPARTLLVASAMSGEGKSSVAMHLGVSLAQAGHRTLVIDGDMRRPRLHTRLGRLTPAASRFAGDGASLELHTRLGQDGSVGLAEVLRDEVTVGQALADTEVPGLSLLAAGRWDPESTRALGSGRWKALLAEVSAAYEYVVIDSPPLLPVADGLAMARDVDGVLLSVLRDVSHLPSVAEAQKRLMAVRANVLGVVLSGTAQVLYRYPPSEPVVQLAALPGQAVEETA
jgi:succinoglycan biosynthesis transport protein ExoP